MAYCEQCPREHLHFRKVEYKTQWGTRYRRLLFRCDVCGRKFVTPWRRDRRSL